MILFPQRSPSECPVTLQDMECSWGWRAVVRPKHTLNFVLCNLALTLDVFFTFYIHYTWSAIGTFHFSCMTLLVCAETLVHGTLFCPWNFFVQENFWCMALYARNFFVRVTILCWTLISNMLLCAKMFWTCKYRIQSPHWMLVVGEGWQLLPEVFLFLLKPITGYWKVSIDVFVKVKVLQNNIFYLRLINDERDPCPGSVVGDLRPIVEPNNLLSGDFTPGRRVHHLIRRFCSPGDQAGQVDHAGGLHKHLRPSHQTRHRIWEYFEVGSSHLWPWGGPRGPCGGLSTPGTRKVLCFPSQTESSRSKHLSQSVECSSTPAASRGCASRGSPQTCSGWGKRLKRGSNLRSEV